MSQHQPHPQQQQPYPPHGYQGRPPKKSHTLRNVLLVLFGLGILFIGGCVAVVGLAANEVDNAITEAEEKDNEPGGPNNPLEITPGEPFEVSGFDYAGGWSIEADALGDVAVNGLKVTNNREDKDSAIVEIKLWRGNEVLASTDCTTDPIQPGTTVRVDCFSADDMPANYGRVTINDTF